MKLTMMDLGMARGRENVQETCRVGCLVGL